MDNEMRFEVIECLAGWVLHCRFEFREDWRKYRDALESGFLIDFWRRAVRYDISKLRKARRVLKEF